LDLSAVEWFWLLVNASALGFQLLSLWWAWDRRSTVKQLNGKAREIAAAGNVRREIIRVAVQLLFIGIAIPSIFSPAEIRLTPPLLCLLLIPPLVCLNSALDVRDTLLLIRIAHSEIEDERARTLTEIKEALDHQTEATIAAIERSRDAEKVDSDLHDPAH
jgi:hypothetical protein